MAVMPGRRKLSSHAHRYSPFLQGASLQLGGCSGSTTPDARSAQSIPMADSSIDSGRAPAAGWTPTWPRTRARANGNLLGFCYPDV